jgi:hypothetical protein
MIDTESPWKHSETVGPNGEITFYDLLEEHEITPP